ncbi:LysR family transcriptional regulator [Dinoroseobacter sp. PD6]|uniref:LysR family transcriptional regulator n=1 Tax=Dinoroseobacter sp. PD6 TaxID=3028384 RepID=UPI00237BE20B|nr:LysR family transcriptional regulator [Dinoroseobacter sp. PD6]MDD9717050.1 LysR family transcriptional regulator [Dinoroseobacter sp. PD6]
MPRNLDLTALRSFVSVAESGGVTKAAGMLNLTQSAVSMQLKRLEENLGLALLDRTGRGVALTPTGDQLLSYARRMLALNDEVYARMTDHAFEGQIALGVPHDIVYPAIPQVLARFTQEFPRVRVDLISSFTVQLKEYLADGSCDLILTTEDAAGPGGEALVELPLIWLGAVGGQAWRKRPLPLAFEQSCLFRDSVQRALDAAGIEWTMRVQAESARTIEPIVAADMGVHAVLEGTEPAHLERIAHGGELPKLTTKKIVLYGHKGGQDPVRDALAGLVRQAYAQL